MKAMESPRSANGLKGIACAPSEDSNPARKDDWKQKEQQPPAANLSLRPPTDYPDSLKTVSSGMRG
jgi:hypothetical protein